MFEFAEENSHLDSDRLADIKVIGVGGAGGNAVGRMIEAGLVGVEFFAVNTDLQALQDSPAHRTLQIGALRTKGLGSGGNPSVGRAAAEEDLEHLRESLAGADMVFVTAGMGGGTGTGAAPVIARVARELGALTVAIVTKPFRFEASVRMQQALAGIEELRQSVDTLIIIPNQRLLEVVPANTSMREAFRIADNVLYEATRGIYEIISRHDHVNLDFADVRTVMKDMGQAMMGTGRAEGPNRAVEAARQAISSPLLENVDIRGSRAVLVNVLGREVGLQDTAEAMEYIQEAAGPQAHVIFGYGNDESMGEMLQLTVIATGFDAARDDSQAFVAAVPAAQVDTAAEAIVQAETAATGDAMPESAEAAGPIMTYVDSDAIGADEIWTEPWPASTLAGDEAIEEAAAAEAAARIAAELEERAREEQELLELEAQLLALEEEELRLAAEAAEAEEAARLIAEEEARLAAEA
ncbi:MAG: cell division protein FtsZ, partial [bacterium]|nr:cell division protein FtsZ [bacterium]